MCSGEHILMKGKSDLRAIYTASAVLPHPTGPATAITMSLFSTMSATSFVAYQWLFQYRSRVSSLIFIGSITNSRFRLFAKVSPG